MSFSIFQRVRASQCNLIPAHDAFPLPNTVLLCRNRKSRIIFSALKDTETQGLAVHLILGDGDSKRRSCGSGQSLRQSLRGSWSDDLLLSRHKLTNKGQRLAFATAAHHPSKDFQPIFESGVLWKHLDFDQRRRLRGLDDK